MNLVRLSCGIVIGVCLAGSASAATIVISVDTTPSRSVQLTLRVNGTNQTAYTGMFRGSVNGVYTTDMLCADMFTNISTGTSYNYNIYGAGSANAAAYSANIGRAAWLWTRYMPDVLAAGHTATGAEIAAALQAAIWDVIHNSGDGLAAGSIQRGANITNSTQVAVYNRASTMITASFGQSTANAAVLINAAGATTSQTIIGDYLMLPEPGTIGLGAAGLALIAFLGRRRRQQ